MPKRWHCCLAALRRRWRAKLNKPKLALVNKPTVNDIARVAGVSLATVDRVLNERPGVRAVTIQKVHEAIEELSYVRDTAAANLAEKNLQICFRSARLERAVSGNLGGVFQKAFTDARQDRTEVARSGAE